jgi:hypothetical protein
MIEPNVTKSVVLGLQATIAKRPVYLEFGYTHKIVIEGLQTILQL